MRPADTACSPGRRGFLGACAALLASFSPGRALAAEEPELEARVVRVGGEGSPANAALVLTPRGAAGGRLPLLVLLHGMAETASEAQGLRAFSEHYGLPLADARLRHPPVTRLERRRYFTDSRLEAINAGLGAAPYGGFVLACPYTPNVYRQPSTAAAIDAYAEWLVRDLLPAVRRDANVIDGAEATHLDGCSLGGYLALEVFTRHPGAFGAIGAVQPAIGEQTARSLAARLEAAMRGAGPRDLHVESSLWDPGHRAHRVLSAGLAARGVAHDLDVLPGGHDQVFLREAGLLEMLLWHDRSARRRRSSPP